MNETNSWIRSFSFAARSIALICLVAAIGELSVVQADAPPNIVVILADDLGYSDLGCYGGDVRTPNLDSLAANGVRFSQFYNTARCWPTRSSLLTGYYAQQIRMDPPKGRLPGWAEPLPKRLKPLGYRSYHSGKWHVMGAPKPIADAGFDHSMVIDDQDRHFYPRDHRLEDEPQPAVAENSGFYGPIATANHAIECLKQHADEHSGKPFFQYVAFTVPHFPVQAIETDTARYLPAMMVGWDRLREQRYQRQKNMGLIRCALSPLEQSVRAPHGEELSSVFGHGEIFFALPWEQLDREQQLLQATKMAIHAAMIDCMDRQIGRILDQLKAMNAMENTMLVFLSDNGASAEIMNRGEKHDRTAVLGSGKSFVSLGPGGSSLSNTPFRRHKIWVHEGGIATPMIVHFPAGKLPKGEIRHTPGHVIDLVPTVMQLVAKLGGEIAPPRKEFAGKSFLDLLTNEIIPEDRELFFHHSGNRALRQGDWKVVSAADNQDQWELYNLKSDRSETNNLAESESDRLKSMTERWRLLEKTYRRDAETE